MAKQTKTPEVVSVNNKTEKKAGSGKGHVFYSVFSKSRGFVIEYMSRDKACDIVDEYWNEHKRNVYTGKWSEKRKFDMYVVKRDTGVSLYHYEHLNYIPGANAEAKREAALRERYGDSYVENDSADNFDSAKYM